MMLSLRMSKRESSRIILVQEVEISMACHPLFKALLQDQVPTTKDPLLGKMPLKYLLEVS